ncbi:response regulator [Ketogulonicigenium vulgare]|uniref:response regulator n=1 Tax=Ketogulonicigenium vulgare TaxID=92945 RepID=UPI0023598760|nr:response regulator [Ketogulonicigenium vulgare]
MTEKRQGLQDTLALVGVAVIVAVTFVGDVISPVIYNVWLAYFLALVLSFSTRYIWLPIVVVGIVAPLMWMGIVLTDSTSIPYVTVLNRSLAVGVMLVLAGVGALTVRARRMVNAHDWEQRTQMHLSRRLLGDLTRQEIGQRSVNLLALALGAKAGVAYELRGNRLEFLAGFGLAADRPPVHGQGHLWRAVHDDQVIHLKVAGEHALGWGTGLFAGKSAQSLIIPLHEGGRVNGILEFGLDVMRRNLSTEFLEQAARKIGIELRSASYREEMEALLEETRRQAETLHSHTEELAASNEELEEQSRALIENEARMREQQSELEEQNAQLEQQTSQLEEQRDALAASRQQLADQAGDLARESRYKSEFVANMSHELRTPLNALLIMARLLSENRPHNLSPEQIQWAETIESSGRDLLGLINDILDLSRIEAGKVDVNPEATQPKDVAARMMRAFAVQASESGLKLVSEVADDVPEITTDVGKLEQILRNFLSNALKFTQKGSVTLSVARSGAETVTFSVKDTGIGIAAEQHDAVFEAFRQADGSISRRFGGTGLGLSISRDLAGILGGDVMLESTPGKGSTFILTLPLHLTAPVPEADINPRPARSDQAMPVIDGPLGGIAGVSDDRGASLDHPEEHTLLIVEDDAAFAQIMRDLARELGFHAIVVGTADDAVRAAQRHRLNGIVLDVGLPDHSGLTVLDRLKRDPKTRHIPVHIVSAQDRLREALAQGAVSYLHKPVAREALAKVLEGISKQLDRRPRQLLIVEDDPTQLSGLKALLGSDDVITRGAATTAEAIAACRETVFDCIVLDMTLPDGSGFDLLEKLSADENAAFPPVIVYTARALTEAEEQHLRRYSRSIIIKGAKSPERLIDEVTLFLHQVVSDLPQRQREMLAASLNRDAQLEGRRILVVEDDVRNIYALTGVFEPHGVHVQIARNGREALEALGRSADSASPKIDLVLMDVMMPEMDGLTATREIRRIPQWKNLPIIMLTAKAMADDQAQCLAAGANDYLSKPLDVDKLLSLTRVWMPR